MSLRTISRRWRGHALPAALLALAALLLVLDSPPVDGAAVVWCLAGLVAGTALGLNLAGRGPRPREADPHDPARAVAQDIRTLQQAFGVLRQQVQATIQTSETAVMSMMERLDRVHREARVLRERVGAAVAHSHHLSDDSLREAQDQSEALNGLAEHQQRADAAQREHHARVQAVAAQVQRLTPLAELISDIARQTNLISINASIEAARAGPEGAGFKVVATEVRRLSAQTAEAAREIGAGIAAASLAIGSHADGAQALSGASAGDRLGAIAQHVRHSHERLAEVVPYLGALTEDMDIGMGRVTQDIVDTLGDMQFQDINRQLLEQINDAMASLSEHFSQVYQLLDGEAPPPPVMLEELLARWTENYVMHSQHVAHAMATGGAAALGAAVAALDEPATTEETGAPDAPPLALATANGPRIELF